MESWSSEPVPEGGNLLIRHTRGGSASRKDHIMKCHPTVLVWGPSMGQAWLEKREPGRNGQRQDCGVGRQDLGQNAQGPGLTPPSTQGPLRTSEEEYQTCVQ